MHPFKTMFEEEKKVEKVDYLKVDPKIPGQNFVCLSFVEPTNQDLVVDRESFFASKFVREFVGDYLQAKDYVDSNPEEKASDEIKAKLDLSVEAMEKKFYEFRSFNMAKLQTEFEEQDEKNKRVSMKGIKVRGTFNTLEEANERAKEMRKTEEAFHVYVGQVGYWMPFMPANTDDITAEYDEDDLNELVHSKIKEDEKRKIEYEERKRKMMEEVAKEEAEKKKNLETVEEGDEEEIAEIVEEDVDDIVEILDDIEEIEEVVEVVEEKVETPVEEKKSKKPKQSIFKKRTNRRNKNKRAVHRKK
jgi:hypothetical protein